jgi:isoamylase
MPVHHHAYDRQLVDRGSAIIGGTTPLAFFAPDLNVTRHPENPVEAVREFKMMVRALHAEGIEVILDVVYNHTAEGNHLGPTLSLAGHRQRLLLSAHAGRQTLLHGLHGVRQHP